MKTNKSIIIPAVILSLAACAKAELPVENVQDFTSGLTFSASISDSAQSKAYFQNTDGEKHNLVWSGYDCLGIFNYTAALTSGQAQKVKGAKSSAPNIDSQDRTKAVFSVPEGTWTKDGVDNYYFYAYYPELGANVKNESEGVISGFSIPEIQSEGFGKYHICSVDAPAIINKNDFASPIALDFSPKTSLFSIHTYIDEGNEDFSTLGIKSVTVTFEGTDASSNPYFAAGSCSLNLSNGSLSPTGGGVKAITIDLSAYYTTNNLCTAIKKSAETEKNVSSTIDIVVLPVEGFTGTLTFHIESLNQSVTIPDVVKNISSKSFRSGGHYNSDVVVNPAYKTLPEANCYIIDAKTVSTISIPLSQGSKGWEAIDNYNQTVLSTATTYKEAYESALTEGVTADIIWSENLNLSIDATQEGKALKIKFSGAQNGNNAVIGIKDKSDKILWSWHLWFTDYNPDNVIDTNTGKVTQGWIHKYKGTLWENGGIYAEKYIMDRNLGATKLGFTSASLPAQNVPDEQYAGLYYQWGRKDPFSINLTPKTANGGVELENGVWNPDTYYTRSDADEDWAKRGSGNVDRWAGKAATVLPKSAFDPCPAGWRVPISYMDESRNKADTWSDFTSSGQFTGRPYGYYYRGANNSTCGNASYPLTGRISRGNFSVALGTTGFLWSASPQPDYATNQYGCARAFATPAYKYGDTTASSIQGISRASAMPVRCVQE